MSIKKLVETMGADSLFDGNLPIPFIDSVEISDESIKIYVSVYIKIPTEDYQKDSGQEFLETFDNIALVVMPLFDRNSNTNHCGVEIGGTYTDLSRDAWTNVTKRGISPVNYWNQSSDSELINVVTHFVFDPGTTSLATNPDLVKALEDDLFIDYALPTGDSASRSNIGNYLDEVSKDAYGVLDPEFYSTNLNLILIDLIEQAISANNGSVIDQLFGSITYKSDGTATTTVGFIPDTTMIKCELSALLFPLGTLQVSEENFAITDIMESSDGSAIIKISKSQLIDNDPNGSLFVSTGLYNRSDSIGAENMGLAAFTMPAHTTSMADLSDEILAAAKSPSADIVYWESAISKSNHILLVKQDDIPQMTTTVYKDSEGKVYQDAMRSIDGRYYSLDSMSPTTVLSSMMSLEELKSASKSTNTSFQYLIAQGAEDPVDVIPLMNNFRRAFPDKSTMTSEGVFYNKFASTLYNANQDLKKGTPLIKTIINNPIVKDWRTYPDSAAYGHYIGPNYEQAYYDIFSFENSLWSRYTEVTGKDADYASDSRTAGADDTSATTLSAIGAQTVSEQTLGGFNWNYNFIDHGFLFFNYERALKTTSYASQYLNIRLFEKYFGSEIFNQLFTMQKCALGTYWGDPERESRTNAGTMMLNVSPGATKQTTGFWHQGAETSSDADVEGFYTGELQINKVKMSPVVSNDISAATAENGYVSDGTADKKIGNEYGGADASVNSEEYSYIALRGFSPITVQEGLNALEVDQTFLEGLPVNYRLACYEVQKCDSFDPGGDIALSDTIHIQDSVLHELDENNRGGAFTTNILVKDATHEVIIYISNTIDSLIETFDEYYRHASDICNFNESTGFFNESFVRTMQSSWPIPSEAPWFKTVVEALIFEDILFNTTAGDTTGMTGKIKLAAANISPETGNLEGVENFQLLLDNLRVYISDKIFTDYPEEQKIVGHQYGHNPYYDDDYDTVETRFTDQVTKAAPRDSTASGIDEEACWVPQAGYDNFPMFPTESTSYKSHLGTADSLDDYDPLDDFDVWSELWSSNMSSDALGANAFDFLELAISARDQTYDNFIDRDMGGYWTLDDFLDEFYAGILDMNGAGESSVFNDAADLIYFGLDVEFSDTFGNTGTQAANNILSVVTLYKEIAKVVDEYVRDKNPPGFSNVTHGDFYADWIGGDSEIVAALKDHLQYVDRKSDAGGFGYSGTQGRIDYRSDLSDALTDTGTFFPSEEMDDGTDTGDDGTYGGGGGGGGSGPSL